MKPYAASQLPPATESGSRLRVATYNIHKGVRGMGPRKRLEIHNLGLGIEALDADLVFLQEVRLYHAGDARRFSRTGLGWPDEGQAEFLAPEGYAVAYRSSAISRPSSSSDRKVGVPPPRCSWLTGCPVPNVSTCSSTSRVR